MSKDLFASTFSNFSRWSLESFSVNYLNRLPYHLIRSATSCNPDIQRCDGFDELFEHFRTDTGTLRKNPEIYPDLNYLNIPNYSKRQISIDALRVHAGLDELKPDSNKSYREGYWRLRIPIQKTYFRSDGSITELKEISTTPSEIESFPTLYRPHPSLFDDIERNFYRGDPSKESLESISEISLRAFSSMQRYSPDLANRFCQEIGTVSFMAREPGTAKSFSKRNFYVGGIFVSIADPIVLAEQFIHEYYHQCVWPWWMVEPPEDLPSDDQIILSPVSGKMKPVSVMIHALLIYISLVDFYKFVLSDEESNNFDASAIEAAEQRLRRIDAGVPPLVEALQNSLSLKPKTLAMVAYIASMRN